MKNGIPENLNRRAMDLVRLIDQLSATHGQLLGLTRRKLQAIRAADLEAMCACNDEQETLLKRLREREGLRKQLMDAIGIELGLAAKTGRLLTITQLLSKLSGSVQQELSAARDRLREAVGKLAQANRINSAVSRELVNHLEFVFSAVRPSTTTSGEYSARGSLRLTNPGLLETIG